MVQWIKNLTVAALVAMDAWIQPPAQHNELKDPLPPQLWHRSAMVAQIQRLGPGTSICLGCGHKIYINIYIYQFSKQIIW